MDPTENESVPDDNNSEEQQGQSQGAESSVRPSLSQVRKSWGFRRTTIARREFLDEVGDLNHSPPHARRGRNRRAIQTPQPAPETCATQEATRTTKSVIDDLEWSAPSSPVSEESKPASETSAGESLDPSLWQDFGSAFHTAFSLLGGSESLSMDMSDALAAPDTLQAPGGIEASPAQAIDEPEVPENMELSDDMEISQPASNSPADDVVLISSQEEDSDNMTLIQIKEQLASKGKQAARGGKGGRGKARGRGRGRGKARGKGKGRGRGRGRAVELQSTIVDDDSDDDVMLVNPAEPQLHEEEKLNDSSSPAEIETSPAHSDISLSPAQRSSSDCIIIDSDLDQVTYATPGQYDDALEEKQEEGEDKKKGEENKDDKNEAENSGILDNKGYDSNALFCICGQKHNERFVICCDSCHEWFHGNCVGISQTQGRQMERKGQQYICPRCTAKKQSQLQLEPEPEPEPELKPELSFPERLTLSPPGEEGEGREEEQTLKETVVVVEEEEAAVTRPKREPEAEMETDSSLPLCIGPECSKQALPDSVYCGTECILQHAAVTMKTLSGPKVPKSKGRTQRKAATARPTTKGQRSCRMSKRLAAKAEEEGEEAEMKEDDAGQKEASSPLACDPRLTEVQATSIPSPQFYTASEEDSKRVEAENEAVTPSTQLPEDTSADAAPSVQPITEPERPQSLSQEKTKKPVDDGVSEQPSLESGLSMPLNQAKCSLSPAAQSPSTSAPRHHETGALMVTKTSYVIPKKQPGPQTQSSKVSVAASSQKPSSAPSLLNETRNLLVPPAPSAPSSRPSQPNNQVRQSIQRSLTSILFKRVGDCEDLKMSEIEVTKLVASIEMEMFNIFRNTDSKYMNKYRTIMFNLKDPKNKGLLYQVIRGEISPFRLARMSQKDMQAIKASEPSPKETTEVKDAADKVTSLLQKPEAVKVDLPSLNPIRRDRNMEQKKSLPASTLKTRTSQPSQGSAVPDVLACMLKDTTSEHKAHLFDLKCKICTGQMLAGDEEPAKKKPKVSETRDKYEPSWRKPAGDDSPLRAPPDSPEMDSPPSRLIIDSPVLTIVESPASPITDSPASPTLESPASPVMQSPASPTPDTPKPSVSKRAYTPVVIPAVSTVSITRRDPRTAASRFSTSSTSTSGSSNTSHNQSVPYAPLKETRSASPPAPTSTLPTKSLPKSILMKPSSSANPRLYGTSSRTVISESPADGETVQFIAKQDILWKGFLNMLSVAKFVTKGYLVSGSAENLKADLPDTIQIGGRIMPETVWDYVAKLKTSVTKELCVIRFHPATEEEEVAYVSLFSYFSSRGRFGVVANSSRSIKDVYLVPLSAKEPIPSILQPLEGPGLEKKRPNLLLGLAIVQKAKRPGNLPLEIEEKRPKVQMAKDPMWIPKPPVLYGSDKLEIFQPYDPETPASTTPPGSPSCPGSPSESSSSGSVTVPSLLTSIRADPPVSTSANVPVYQSTAISISEKNPTTASSDKTPLQTILKTLFSSKQTHSTDGSTTATTGSDKKFPVFSQVSRSMVDPIVQQYGQKSKVKEIEEEENDFDRPYDPEEEYNPAVGYGMLASQSMEKNKADATVISGFVDDDVAYDPEDESIFEDIQSDIVTKPLVPTQTSDSPSCPTPFATQGVTPASTSTPVQTSTSAEVTPTIPTGIVVVSAATLTEQQRMLEELNKQIEEQKRQLKEQEEALRQQREAVGMFMAHFSVSDTLMSPPSKSLPHSQLSTLPSGIMQTESKPSESTDNTSSLIENVAHSNVDSQTVKPDTTVFPNVKNDRDTVTEQDETQENVKESDKFSSAGEIEDSDVAYDPEDESLFNEIQDDVFQGSSVKTCDSSWSRQGHSACHKGSQNSHHSRKRRLSPKRRSHRERDRHRSPSRKSQRRSPSHSQRRGERDRHRKSERDRSRHRNRDQSERQGRHRKEHSTRRHSHGRRRSSLSPKKKDSVSPSPKPHRGPSPQDPEKSSTSDTIKNDPDGHQCNLVESPDKDFSSCSHGLLQNVKLEILEHPSSISVHDNTSGGCSTQVDKFSLQETLFTDKLDSTIPLREIDPPIRDSPQSPDPEPQFAKPNSTEKSDFKSEEIGNPETHSSVSLPPVKMENTVHQAAMPNMLWPGGPDVRNLDFRGLAQHGSSVTDQCVIEADKQIEGEGPGLRHPEILGQGGGHYNLAAGSGTKCPGPGMSGPDIRNSGPDMKPSGNSGLQIYPSGSGIRFPGTDIRGPVPNICVPGPEAGMQGEEAVTKEPGIQHHNSDIIGSGSDIRGFGMKSPVQAMESPRMQGVNPEIKGPCPGVRDSNPEMRGQILVPAVRETLMRGSALQNARRDEVMRGSLSDRLGSDGPDIRNTGPSFSSSGRVHKQSRHNGSSVSDEGGAWKKGFQPHGRDSDLNRVGDGRESSFDSNALTGSEGIVLRADRPSPAVTNDRRGPQRGRDVPMRRPGPNIIYESDGPREHLKEPQPDIRDESYMGSKQMDPEERGPMPNIKNPDWRSPGPGLVGPDIRGQRSQNKGRGRHMRDTNWSGPGLDIDDGWRGPDRGASGPLRGGPVMQDEWRVHQPDGRGQNMESQGPDRRGIGDQNFRETGPEISSNTEHLRHERRGPGGPDFMGSGYERRGSEMEVLVHDRRGPGGPDFRRPEPENRGSTNDNLESSMRRPVAPNLMRPGLDRRCLPMEDPVPTRRGPAVPEFRGPWSERRDPGVGGPRTDRHVPGTDFSEPERGLSMEGPGPPQGGPGGPDFRGPGRERRGPAMEGPGIDRRGPGGPDFRGPGPESRGLSMEGHGPDRRGPGGPDFRGPGPERKGPEMEGPETDRRGPGGPDFRGPGPESRSPAMDNPGTGRRGPGGPDFRGPGPERRGPVMGGAGPDRRGPGGPDFRGPWPEDSLSIEGPGPDRRGPGGPDFRGPGPESRGLSMEGHWPDRRGPGGPDFRGPGPEWRHPLMDAPGPDRRVLGGPDFSMPGPDRRVPAIGDLGPDWRESGVTDFSGLGNERRGHNMESQESDRRGPGCLDFQGPWSGRREPGGPDTRAPGCERRGPFMQDQGPDSRGPGDQNTGGFGPDSRALYISGPGPDFIGVGPERTGPGIDYSGPHDRGQAGPHFRGPGPRSGHPHMEGAWPDKEGPEIRPRLERPGSYMEGPGPNREPGGPNIRRPGPQHSSQNIEGPGLDKRRPEGPNLRGPGPERRPQDMDGSGNSRSFPGGQFRGPEPERRPPDMEHPGSDRRGPHLRGMRPERTVIDGPGFDRKGLRGPDFRGPVFQSRGPQIEGPGLDRQEPGGLRFREPVPERRGPDMEGSQSDWRRSGGPDFRGPGIRQKGPNTEVPRDRDDWGGADFRGLGPIQERPDIEGPGPERPGQNMRGLGPMRRNFSGPGPNMNQGGEWNGPDFRGSEHLRRDTEEQWSDGRGPYMEPVRNECPEDGWERHGNMGPGPISEGPDKQAQEHCRQGPHMGRRGRGSRGSRRMQERPHMPLRGPGDDWGGPGCRGPGPVQEDPDMVYPEPDTGEPGNEWREPDTGSGGPNRWGSGPFFRGERDQDNIGQGHDRQGPGMRGLGSDRRRGADMKNDWKQPEFRDNMRGPNMDGPPSHREDSELINSYPNRRGFELEGLDRRGPGSENRNSNIEGTDRRFPDCGGLGTERRGANMDSPGTGRQGFEQDYRRERRGPDMRRPGPGKTDMRQPSPHSPDIRHEPGRWDTNTEGPLLDLGGSEPASFHFSSPHQVTRFQGPSDSLSAHHIGPLGPAQNSGGNSCPGFDDLQNRQALKPQRHRTALLPTPTEGLIRFPNRVINNPDVFSPKRKQVGHQKDREWSRGRSVSRERELVKGQRQEQEKSPAGKLSTPLDTRRGRREEKKEEGNENNKEGNSSACLETKTNQNVDNDANKSSAKPS